MSDVGFDVQFNDSYSDLSVVDWGVGSITLAVIDIKNAKGCGIRVTKENAKLLGEYLVNWASKVE